MRNFKIFAVGYPLEYEYIVATTKEEALNDYLTRAELSQEEIEEIEVEEVSFERAGRFETENGWEDMTFREFLGEDFVYTKPQLICWNE